MDEPQEQLQAVQLDDGMDVDDGPHLNTEHHSDTTSPDEAMQVDEAQTNNVPDVVHNHLPQGNAEVNDNASSAPAAADEPMVQSGEDPSGNFNWCDECDKTIRPSYQQLVTECQRLLGKLDIWKTQAQKYKRQSKQDEKHAQEQTRKATEQTRKVNELERKLHVKKHGGLHNSPVSVRADMLSNSSSNLF